MSIEQVASQRAANGLAAAVVVAIIGVMGVVAAVVGRDQPIGLIPSVGQRAIAG